MSGQNVVLSVTAYASEAAARRDLAAVGRASERGSMREAAAAVLHKGSDGALTIDQGDVVEPGAPWGGALLGAALIVLVAPVGIALLPPVVTSLGGWIPVATLVDHFWQEVPQETLHRMSEMLESNPAGIVIVAVDLNAQDLKGLLSEARATIVTDSTILDRGDTGRHGASGLDS